MWLLKFEQVHDEYMITIVLLLPLVCSTLDIVENFKVEFEQIDVEGEYMSVSIADLLGNTISLCITYQ